MPNCTCLAVKFVSLYLVLIFCKLFLYKIIKILFLWNAKVLANMPYKFAILEASHNGAKDPKYFTESSYKKNSLLPEKSSKIFCTVPYFFLYLFSETIL